MNTPFPNAPRSVSALRERSMRELQQFYQKPIAKVSIELIITIFTVIFLAIFAIQPTITTMSALVKNIEDKQKVDQELTKKAAALSTLNSELAPLKSQVRMLNSAIPNEPDIDGILRRIEKIASGRPIVLTSIQSNKTPKDEDPDRKGVPELSTLTLQIGVKGSYLDIKDFLEAILKIDRQFTVVSLSISTQKNLQFSQTTNDQGSSSATSPSPELQMGITVEAHYFGVPVEIAAAG